MRQLKGLISFAGTANDTINSNARNFHIFGSSIPTLMEKGKSYEHVSITFSPEKQKVLVFFKSSRSNEAAFLQFRRKENGQAWAYLEEKLVPPCEMVVNNEGTITIKTSDAKIVTTGNRSGEYKVAHDAMCQFLIGDITEEELLAEAIKRAEKESELEQLRRELTETQSAKERWMQKCRSTEATLSERMKLLWDIHNITKEKWYSKRMKKIQKVLSKLPGVATV